MVGEGRTAEGEAAVGRAAGKDGALELGALGHPYQSRAVLLVVLPLALPLAVGGTGS